MSRLNIFVKLLILVALAILWYFRPTLIFQESWLDSLLNFAIFVFSLNTLLTLFVFFYRRRKGLGPKGSNNVTQGTRNIYYLIISISTIGFILSLTGVAFGTLFTSLSIIAAAIAIITKEYISPIIAGFHIALSNTISINDYVKIADLKGKVVDIRLTKLKLLSEDDELIIISNDKAYFSEIMNFTKGNVRKININFDLSPNNFVTIETLERELIDEIKDYASHIVDDSYILKVGDITKDVIKFKFQYELKKNDDRVFEEEIRRKTVRKVINGIKQNASPKAV
jgi:small-conductance mechanosensitive channel